MLNGWIISDKKDGQGYFTGEDLARIRNLPFKLEQLNLSDISLEVAEDKIGQLHVKGEYRPKPDFALCLFEKGVDWVHFSLLRQLEMHGIFSPHKAQNIAMSVDKLYTAQILLKAGIPVAKTLVMEAHTSLDWLAERIGFPMVVKLPDGSKGEGVCLVKSAQELRNIHDLYCKTAGQTLLAQEFVATSKGRDVRITMCDGEVVFGVLRDNSKGEDFRSNISVGGQGEYWEPDAEAVRIAKAVVKAMDVKLCGVDLLFGPDGYLVGEINSMPGCLHINHNGKSNLERLLEAIFRTVLKYAGGQSIQH